MSFWGTITAGDWLTLAVAVVAGLGSGYVGARIAAKSSEKLAALARDREADTLSVISNAASATVRSS